MSEQKRYAWHVYSGGMALDKDGLVAGSPGSGEPMRFKIQAEAWAAERGLGRFNVGRSWDEKGWPEPELLGIGLRLLEGPAAAVIAAILVGLVILGAAVCQAAQDTVTYPGP